MINVGKVTGSPEMAIPVYVGKDRVDVHSNITFVEPEEGDSAASLPGGGGGYWEYDETQYDRQEYAQKEADDVIQNEEALTELDTALDDRIAAIEDAVCELDEKFGGAL